jgi:hypothetical protein
MYKNLKNLTYLQSGGQANGWSLINIYCDNTKVNPDLFLKLCIKIFGLDNDSMFLQSNNSRLESTEAILPAGIVILVVTIVDRKWHGGIKAISKYEDLSIRYGVSNGTNSVDLHKIRKDELRTFRHYDMGFMFDLSEVDTNKLAREIYTYNERFFNDIIYKKYGSHLNNIISSPIVVENGMVHETEIVSRYTIPLPKLDFDKTVASTVNVFYL